MQFYQFCFSREPRLIQDVCNIDLAEHDMAAGLSNSQQLRLSTQNLRKIKPVNTLSWKREGFPASW